MTPERLEEIRRLAAESSVFLGTGLAPIRELLAEVDRLRGALEEAGEYVTRWKLEWLPHHAYRDENVAAEADRKRVQGIIRAALSPSPEPRAAIGGGDCGVCYLNPCCCAPPPPREAEPTQSEPGRCTCGSGGHPRRCEQHPGAYERHVAEIEAENRAPDAQSEPGPEGHCCVRQKCTADALDSCCCPECAARRTPRAPSPAPEPRREFSELRNYDALAHGEISREEFARRELARAEPRKEPERELDFKTFCTGEPPPHDWDVSAPTAAFCRRCGMYRPYAVRTWTREQIEAALYEAQTDTAGDSTALDESAFWRALEGT